MFILKQTFPLKVTSLTQPVSTQPFGEGEFWAQPVLIWLSEGQKIASTRLPFPVPTRCQPVCYLLETQSEHDGYHLEICILATRGVCVCVFMAHGNKFQGQKKRQRLSNAGQI